VITDEMIVKMREKRTNKMADQSILCYADNAMLFANCEDDLQSLLYIFIQHNWERPNMIISEDEIRDNIDGASVMQPGNVMESNSTSDVHSNSWE